MLGLNPATMASRERSSGLASDYGAPVRERRFRSVVQFLDSNIMLESRFSCMHNCT